LRQDDSGRWVSDDGRYLWNGVEWLDLEASDSEGAAEAPRPGVTGHRRPRSGQPLTRATHAGSPSHHPPRPVLLLVGLLALVALGVVALLFVGNRSPARPSSTTPSPAVSDAAPDGRSPSPTTASVPDEFRRRERAQGALLHRSDLPGATEERPSTPTDVFLPCRSPALVPPAGSVLAGQAVSNSDFTLYVGQTVAGFPTTRQAAEALAQIRSAVSRCAPYDYRYANSARIDRITHTDVDPALPLGDGGVYLAEVDTPSNYAGTPTTYSYGYVQRGQFLIRLTLTNNSLPDRPGLELLMRKTIAKLG
jgi:hypothetical protein